MSNPNETRTVTSPRTGTKVCLLIALSLLAIAAYFFMTKTYFQGKDGGLFGCGSPMSPNEGPLGKSQCNMVEGVAQKRAILFAVLALIVGGLGALLFGADKKEQERAPRQRLEDAEDGHDDGDHGDARSARSKSLLAGRSEREGRDKSESRGSESDRRSLSRKDDDSHEVPQRKERRARLGDEDERPRPRSERRSRLGDEDVPQEQRPVRRSRLSDDDDRAPRVRRARLSDDDSRERPRRRYDDDAFDSARD